MNKNLAVLFAVSLISMQVVASDKNAELAAKAELISSHILEALVNEAIVEAQAVVNKSMVKKGHVADALIVRTSRSAAIRLPLHVADQGGAIHHNNFYWEGGSAVLYESGYLPPQSSQTLTSEDISGLMILNDIKRTLTARRQQSDKNK